MSGGWGGREPSIEQGSRASEPVTVRSLFGGPSVASEQGSDRRVERSPNSGERPPNALAVERVTHQDVPAICNLYKKVWESVPGGLPAELLKAWQPSPLEFTSWMEGVTYFAARKDGRLIGVVGCELRHGACRLVHLAVEPDGRRQGVGAALIGAAIDWARRSSATTVWADTLERFHAAASLFRKLGFQETGILHQHEWNEDVRFFEHLLSPPRPPAASASSAPSK